MSDKPLIRAKLGLTGECTPQTSPFETDGRHVVRNGVRVATCKDVPEAAWIASACNRELAASSETSTPTNALGRACAAAFAFIDSHVADPDITEEMCIKYAEYQEARRELEGGK